MEQLIVNALASAGQIYLVGAGFAIIYLSGRFFHFAHGAVITAAAYAYYVFNVTWAWPAIISFVVAVISASVSGAALELLVYRPLRNRKASTTGLLLASLGLYVGLINLLALSFGEQTLTLKAGAVAPGIHLINARISEPQLFMVAMAAVLLALLHLIGNNTLMGKRFRALSESHALAGVVGINIDHMILGGIVVGSAIGGTVGILTALDTAIRPFMGLQPLMLGVVAVIIGRGQPIALGASVLFIAGLQVIVTAYLGLHWRDPVVFLLLIAFLMLRPYGAILKKPS